MYIYTLCGIMVNLPQYSWNQKCNLKLLGTMQNLWQGPGLFITLVSSYLAEVRDQGQGATARTPQHRTIMKDDGLLGFSGILPISSLIQGGKSSHIFCAVSKNCHDLVAEREYCCFPYISYIQVALWVGYIHQEWSQHSIWPKLTQDPLQSSPLISVHESLPFWKRFRSLSYSINVIEKYWNNC